MGQHRKHEASMLVNGKIVQHNGPITIIRLIKSKSHGYVSFQKVGLR